MLIKELELKNVKSYADDTTIQFKEGTNIIAGNNGAGKTTIVESIGYALFDYNPYKRKDFLLRHGEKDGRIRVRIVAEDQREYDVVRHIGKATYYVYDPEKKRKLDLDGKDDVVRWLSKKLGIGEEVEDLSNLFRNAVGVEQGLITAPFLDTPEERKRKFRSLLRVEGYKKAFNEAVRVVNFIKESMQKKVEKISELRGELLNFEEEKKREKALRKEIEQMEEDLERIKKDVEEKKEKKERMEKLKEKIEQKERNLEREKSELITFEIKLKNAEEKLKKSQEAKEIVEKTNRDYESYQQTKNWLEALERQKKKCERLQKEKNEIEKRIIKLEAALRHLEEEFKEIEEAEKEMLRIQPLSKKERELEKALEEKMAVQEHLRRLKKEIEEKEIELKNKRKRLLDVEEELSKLPLLRKMAESLSEIEESLDKLHKKKAEEEVALSQEREKMESLSQGVCPFFKETCPKIGQDPTAFKNELMKRMQELKKEIKISERALSSLLVKKREAEEAGRKYNQLLGKRDELEAIKKDCEELEKKIRERKEEKAKIEMVLEEKEEIEKALENLHKESMCESLTTELEKLKDKVKKKKSLEEEKEEMKAKLTDGLKEKVKIEKELDRYSGVDEKIENAKTKLRELEPNYWLYKKNKDLAEEIERYLKEYEDLKRKRQEIENRLQSLFREVEVLKGQYNQERYENLRKECESALEKKHRLDAELRGKKKNLEELTNKIQRLQHRKEEKDELEKDLKEEECLLNFLEKIRDIFNKAPDRLTEVYLERINREANLRFQELFGEPNLELRWENDFGITVREGPHEKYFGQLSGGQQMCAALAVRLALLRYLSDVNLAFFDEPTQNLDLERRENLAEAIRNIKGFRQLFIISHDETFHDLVENTIFLKNEDGKTEVVSEL